MQFSYLELIIFLTLFQLILLALVLIQKDRNSLSNQLFILFLIAQIITLANSLLLLNWNYSSIHIPSLFYLSPPFWFVFGPSIYLFIKVESSEKYVFKRFDWLHFIPALLMAIYFTKVFHIHPAEQKRLLLSEGTIFSNDIHLIVDRLMMLHVLGYIIAAIVRLERFANTQKDLPTKAFHNRLSWNRFIIYTYLGTCILYDITGLFNSFLPKPFARNIISLLLFCLYFAFILYRALISSHFATLKTTQKAVLNISKNEACALIMKLELFMQSTKPYLEFNLTLSQLSEMIDEKERQISMALNQLRNQNFHDYINFYRIEEVKEQLKQDKENKKTILEILYACGFNSKSTFNLAFKKYTGISPTQYRKSIHA